jgi:AmmeMemoRadiSam system protein B
MNTIRHSAVAGLFYPEDAETLREAVETYLHPKETNENCFYLEPQAAPKAIIVPHAGYVYSASTAADAFRILIPYADKMKRVVLLGPSHRVGFEGIAFCSADYFRTPLGDVEIDHSAFARISDIPYVGILNQAHKQEHSLEVQLPFLQTILPSFKLVPLVVGDINKETIATVLNALWGGDETLIVISSDLSHYHDYDTARQLDSKTSHAIEQMQPGDIEYDQACGRNPINGLLHLGKQKHLRAKTLALCNSGDTAGDKNRVVGYGAWAFWEPQ